jgi:hypothetical protein
MNKALTKTPMFLKFMNKEIGVMDLLISFSKSKDEYTAKTVQEVINTPPDLEEFRLELKEAVDDIIKDGVGEEFKSFVNNYMEPSLEEELTSNESPLGENRLQIAKIKDKDATWIQGFICYNLCLYIKAFGLDDLKKCRVCGKVFCHKGQYAVYCSDPCKANKNKVKKDQNE